MRPHRRVLFATHEVREDWFVIESVCWKDALAKIANTIRPSKEAPSGGLSECTASLNETL